MLRARHKWIKRRQRLRARVIMIEHRPDSRTGDLGRRETE
ncbi:hypothetical protein YT1_2985 [Rhodococcus ruber]|nr:hypothetical protein YT1_2985 [Rhodococcus ruber]